MNLFRLGALAAALLIVPAAAHAQARPPAQKTGPITIYGDGSTGNGSLFSVTPNALAPSGSLASWLYAPAFPGAISATGGRIVQPNPTSAPAADGAAVTAQNSSLSAADIFKPQVPAGWFTWEGVRSVVDVQPNSGGITTSAFGFYVRNRAVSNGLGGNASGMYGTIACVVDNSSCWGTNPTLIDAAANGAATTGTGRKLIGSEIDLTATSPNTIIQGIALAGSSQVQPAGADGFSCGSLGGPAVWKHCFVAADGTATNGAYFGVLPGTAAGTPSMPIEFGFKDASSVNRSVTAQAVLGALVLRPTSAANGLSLGTATAGNAPVIQPFGTDTNIGLTLQAVGSGNVVTQSPLIANVGFTSNSTAIFGQPLKLPVFSVANLPACNSGSIGLFAAVSDASNPTWNGGLVGGGSTRALAFCNGGGWTAH